MRVRLTDEEHAKLLGLYREAQTTPVLVFDRSQPDTAALAWSRVRSYMDELGRKYGYDPLMAGVRFDSPEFEAEARR